MRRPSRVSVLFSEPKISQLKDVDIFIYSPSVVSVLFSEPKISQSSRCQARSKPSHCFSALQRAENFSIHEKKIFELCSLSFSALQRAENFSIERDVRQRSGAPSFSALQRAENFSIIPTSGTPPPDRDSFSALQRAENFSM